MQPRYVSAIPQMMQRHTGTAWQQGDSAGPAKQAVCAPSGDEAADNTEQPKEKLRRRGHEQQ